MNKPSVARTCSHCEKPIPTAKQRAYFDGKLVGSECLRALKTEKALAAAAAPKRVSGKSSGTGLGARLSRERREKIADENAKLRSARAAKTNPS